MVEEEEDTDSDSDNLQFNEEEPDEVLAAAQEPPVADPLKQVSG